MKVSLEIVLALVLFALFERKRLAVWREKLLAMRRKARQPADWHTLAAALTAASFLDGLSAQESHALSAAIETTGYGGVFEHPWRAHAADDEELAEGQVGEYLRLWEPAFARLGVAPVVGESRFVDGGAHMLDLPSEIVTLVTDEEAEQDEPGKRHGFSWGAVGARLLQRLNKQLEAGGVSDRLYSVYSGNDAQALLLTPSMLAAIVATPGVKRDELPYTRTLEWPYFGMNTSSDLKRKPLKFQPTYGQLLLKQLYNA